MLIRSVHLCCKLTASLCLVIGQMLFLQCDVSNEEQVKACVTGIEQEFGGLDVLVNK